MKMVHRPNAINPISIHSNNKVLSLNGRRVIELTSHYECVNRSMFLHENILIFVREGCLKLRYGKMEYQVVKDQIVLVKKDILIEFDAGLPRPDSLKNEYIIFSVTPELLKEFTRFAELRTSSAEDATAITVDIVDKQLLTYMDAIETFFCETTRIEDNLVKIKLFELLFYLSRSGSKIMVQLLDLKEHYHSNITTTVEENLMNSLSLNQLAVLSGRSLSSFRRDFLAIYNMPPSEWIRQKRLEKARELLLNTTMPIADVCYTLGFENAAHFSRLFKSHFQSSPSNFRMSRQVA
jgi:AraC-like DNA-binding protein